MLVHSYTLTGMDWEHSAVQQTSPEDGNTTFTTPEDEKTTFTSTHDINTPWVVKTTLTSSVDGSVFGCHCENSFPDTHNNIQCGRNRTKNLDVSTVESRHFCTSVRLYVCTSVLLYVCTSVRLYVCTSLSLYVCTNLAVIQNSAGKIFCKELSAKFHTFFLNLLCVKN